MRSWEVLAQAAQRCPIPGGGWSPGSQGRAWDGMGFQVPFKSPILWLCASPVPAGALGCRAAPLCRLSQAR